MKPTYILQTLATFFFVFTATAQQGINYKAIINDANGYPTVQIGTQIWMAENLRVTHLKDGTPIAMITGNSEWENYNHVNPAYCWYENNESFGYLYNIESTIIDEHICPSGWHVSTDIDWTILSDYLGGEGIAGGKLKALELWSAPNTGATNETGFAALPLGYRNIDGTFGWYGEYGYWWTSDWNNDYPNFAWFYAQTNPESVVDLWGSEKQNYDPGTETYIGGPYTCGHYLNLINPIVTQVGCGEAVSVSGGWYYVCQYIH